MIPKIIHFCWFGGNPLPRDVKQCINSWKKYCPDYKIVLWNEKNYNINKHDFLRNAYKNKKWAFVSDYARLDIIYNFGGFYLDTDVELLKSLDELRNNKCILAIAQSMEISTGLGFGAEKKNSFIKSNRDRYDTIDFINDNLSCILCPKITTEIVESLGYNFKKVEYIQKIDDITVYPARFFDPICPGDSKNLLCSETYSIHHYSASWCTPRNRIKRKLIRFVGEEKVHNLKIKIKK